MIYMTKISHLSNTCTNVTEVNHFDYTCIINIGWFHKKNLKYKNKPKKCRKSLKSKTQAGLTCGQFL
jgi:hypothetical protein